MHKEQNGIVWTLALAFGVGLGLAWMAISVLVFISSAQGFANDRADWGAGWALVGGLLMGAGLSALLGTLWHRRIVRRHY